MSLKAGLAAGAALLIDQLTGNPDHVSSTFIAVVCVSPVVLIGLRRAWDQVMGSAIGGTCGTLAASADLPLELGIPLAVGVGVLLCFLTGFGEGYLLASFAALFVQAVPFGAPMTTLGIRALAVGTGGVSGLVINLVVSSFAYRSIFTRRLRVADATVQRLLLRAAEEGPESARRGLPYLLGLSSELAAARRELEWRRDSVAWVDPLQHRLDRLQRLLHLLIDLGDLSAHHEVERHRVIGYLDALVHGRPTPLLPEAFRPTTSRLEALWLEAPDGPLPSKPELAQPPGQ